MTVTDAMREAAPAPLYPCKNEYCEHTFPADNLAWWRDGSTATTASTMAPMTRRRKQKLSIKPSSMARHWRTC